MAEVREKTDVPDKPEVDIYDLLKETVIRLPPKDRFCLLLFDECVVDREKITLSKIDPDLELPTHVIIFMLRGAYGEWKQPISNVFWRRQGGGPQLGEIIKTIIKKVHKSALTVIATVSDHSEVNAAALEYLTKDKKINESGCSYMVDFNKIHHVYDPCRLLKSVRNQFIKKDLIFEDNKKTKVASWKYILQAYNINESRGSDSHLPKIKKSHVLTQNLDKKITHCCTQVFSETFSREITREISNKKIEKAAQDTAELLLFFDKLFDTCNGLFPYAMTPKPYRCAMGTGNPHFIFWAEAEKVLDTMRFVCPETNKVFRPDCLDKWIVTLAGMKNVGKLLKKSKIKFVATRKFNLDPLVNLTQILKFVNDSPAQIYCESTEGELLSQQVSLLVLDADSGYFEVE